MTAAKQDLEVRALIAAFNTHLQGAGFGTIPFNDGFAVDEQIVPPLIAVHYLPNGPEPFQMGDTTQKYYQRVLQIDGYMETKGRALALMDDLMDYLDLMAVSVADPLNGNAIVGSITCQNTDSVYSQLGTLNFEVPRRIQWRAIIRATLESHYPNG